MTAEPIAGREPDPEREPGFQPAREPGGRWPMPPLDGYTVDDLFTLPDLPPHTELIDGRRPLEPWQAEEFLAHIERGREFIGQHISLTDANKDLESARTFLQSYMEKAATDTGRIYGIWTADDKLVGGVLFRTMDPAQGTAEAGCWLEPSAVGKGPW